MKKRTLLLLTTIILATSSLTGCTSGKFNINIASKENTDEVNKKLFDTAILNIFETLDDDADSEEIKAALVSELEKLNGPLTPNLEVLVNEFVSSVNEVVETSQNVLLNNYLKNVTDTAYYFIMETGEVSLSNRPYYSQFKKTANTDYYYVLDIDMLKDYGFNDDCDAIPVIYMNDDGEDMIDIIPLNNEQKDIYSEDGIKGLINSCNLFRLHGSEIEIKSSNIKTEL